jgi:hypothetical protein
MIISKQNAIEKTRKVNEKIIDPVLLSKLRNLFQRNLSLACMQNLIVQDCEAL